MLDSNRFGVVLLIRQQYLMLNADGSNAELTHVHAHTDVMHKHGIDRDM